MFFYYSFNAVLSRKRHWPTATQAMTYFCITDLTVSVTIQGTINSSLSLITPFFFHLHEPTPSAEKVDERVRTVQITGARRSGRGPGDQLCYIRFVFLGSTRRNYVVTCHDGATCGQWPSCLRRPLFPSFFSCRSSLAGRWKVDTLPPPPQIAATNVS